MSVDRTLLASELEAETGATYRQIDSWSTSGYLSVGNIGSGHRRQFTEADIEVAKTLVALADAIWTKRNGDLYGDVVAAVRRGETSISVNGLRIDWTEANR